MYRSALLVLIGGLFLIAAVGCQGYTAPGGSTSDKLDLPVSLPVERMVTNYEEFTGRTNAVQVVDIRARVTGYLDEMPFKEGAEIRKGDLLFVVDPRPYQAQLDQAVAQVNSSKASVILAQKTYQRDQDINSGVKGGVSQQQIDQDKAAVDEAEAKLAAAEASTKVYKLNLDFCRVLSPIDGQVSRYYITRGNLVNQDSTLLTTIVSLDPMFTYFDMDEPNVTRINQAIVAGRINVPQDGKIPVLMGLPSESTYPYKGTIDFSNNQINSGTGSRSMRGVFDNPHLPKGLPGLSASTIGLLAAPLGQGPLLPFGVFAATPGTRMLVPGMFVRIRLPIGEPSKALLISDKAIQADQGLKYVYVLDANNKAQYRKITTGVLQADGLRVVEGVKATEWVVVGGIQQVRPNMEINPEQRAMPTTNRLSQDEEKGTKGQGDKGSKAKQP